MLGDSLRRRRPAGRSEPADESPDMDGPVSLPGPGRRPRSTRGGRTEVGWGRGPVWARWLGLGVLVLTGSFAVGYLLASQFLFPRPETAGTGVPVPSLYGMDVEEAARVLDGVGLEVGPVMQLASERTTAGRVLAQDPVPEQQLRPGAAVALAVSSGPPEARVPPLTGLGATTARDLLETAGFDVEVQQVRTEVVPAGTVVRTEPEAGAMTRLPASITVVVNAGPPEPEPADEPDPADEPGPPGTAASARP